MAVSVICCPHWVSQQSKSMIVSPLLTALASLAVCMRVCKPPAYRATVEEIIRSCDPNYKFCCFLVMQQNLSYPFFVGLCSVDSFFNTNCWIKREFSHLLQMLPPHLICPCAWLLLNSGDVLYGFGAREKEISSTFCGLDSSILHCVVSFQVLEFTCGVSLRHKTMVSKYVLLTIITTESKTVTHSDCDPCFGTKRGWTNLFLLPHKQSGFPWF